MSKSLFVRVFASVDDLILIPVSIFDGAQQLQFLKFQNKPSDSGISRIAKILFQLLGGKFTGTVSRENKVPQGILYSYLSWISSVLSTLMLTRSLPCFRFHSAPRFFSMPESTV